MNFVELFNRSYEENVHAEEDAFFEQFAENLQEASDLIGSFCSPQDKSLVEDTLLLLLDFAAHRKGNEALKRLAMSQARAGIGPDFYDVWMATLLKTVAQLDPNFRWEDALAWRVMLAPGIEFMKHYKPYA